MTARLELVTEELKQLCKTRHQLIDWRTHISNLLENNTTYTVNTLRMIKELQHLPPTLTKYKTVLKPFRENFDTYE